MPCHAQEFGTCGTIVVVGTIVWLGTALVSMKGRDPWRYLVGALFILAFIAFVLDIISSSGDKTAFVTGVVFSASGLQRRK